MIKTQGHEEIYFSYYTWTSYVLLSDYLKPTLKFNTVPVRLHSVVNIVNQNLFIYFFILKHLLNSQIIVQII